MHLHHPAPRGLKADQLNHAAAYCLTALPHGTPPAHAFVVRYNADSRPPQESLACFTKAITDNPDGDVVYQSPASSSGRYAGTTEG